MNEIVEQVAEAIYKSTWMWDGKSDMPADGWAGISPTLTGDRYRQFARAAITAMWEPTEAMCAVNCEPVPMSGTEDYRKGERQLFRRYWKRMIEAACPRETSGG